MDGKDDLFGWVPDMDRDGDHDLLDFMIYDDVFLNDEEEHDTLNDDFYDDDEDF